MSFVCALLFTVSSLACVIPVVIQFVLSLAAVPHPLVCPQFSPLSFCYGFAIPGCNPTIIMAQ